MMYRGTSSTFFLFLWISSREKSDLHWYSDVFDVQLRRYGTQMNRVSMKIFRGCKINWNTYQSRKIIIVLSKIIDSINSLYDRNSRLSSRWKFEKKKHELILFSRATEKMRCRCNPICSKYTYWNIVRNTWVSRTNNTKKKYAKVIRMSKIQSKSFHVWY